MLSGYKNWSPDSSTLDAGVLPSEFDIWKFSSVNFQISNSEGRTPASILPIRRYLSVWD